MDRLKTLFAKWAALPTPVRIGAIAFVILLGAKMAFGQAVEALNRTIDQTNFIVGAGMGHCSGELISLEYRLILTNNHCVVDNVRWVDKKEVVDGEVMTRKVEVRYDMTVQQKFYEAGKEVGRSTYQAEIVSYNKEHDLALLQVKTAKLPNEEYMHIFAGKQGDLQRGSKVYTIGNPLMLDASVMTGVVASVNRVFPLRDGGELALIQTDAGIAPGSSGGALVNEDLQMIGVTALIARGTQIGLAIAYWDIQKFLTGACYEDVWNPEGQSHADCEAAKTPADDGKTVKDLLRELVDKQQ